MGSQFKAISRQDVRPLSRSRSSTAVSANNVAQLLRQFTFNGVPTVEAEENGLRYFINEFWTSGQRQAHSLHEISYRACFKPQLPDFFISRLTEPREAVYDPFSGRGTTAVQAALLGRRPVANDINPLSAILVQPRLDPPCITEIRARLKEIDFERVMPADTDRDLTVFYHPVTLRQICALRGYLLEGNARGRLDRIDQWIRMVAINRLTGHSPGFFSVYTLPPNQAVSVEVQRKINEARQQIPPPRDIAAIIMKKSKSLLADGVPPSHPPAFLTTRPASAAPEIRGIEAALLVTSPPFLDVVDYEGDNWLRCWFAGIDAKSVAIARYKDVRAWEGFVRQCFHEFANILRPGALVAFEVGEVRGGKILLERHVSAALAGLPFEVLGVMLNQQEFTKTANCWGVANNRSGTNTNRIVLAHFRGKGLSGPA